MRRPPVPKSCAKGGRRGRTAHVQPLPAVPDGRCAPAAMARRVVKGLLLLEAAGLLGALLLYRAMDRSQGAAGGRPGEGAAASAAVTGGGGSSSAPGPAEVPAAPHTVRRVF